jgi:inositol 1,4,5-triphosphate receptor type 1
VPTFVSRFWPYPEVQKMKDSIVMQVNRQSPEEKLADYLQQMLRITTVMKRQERLRAWLTFPLHAFFGGKTTSQSQFFPNQRMLALIVTLVLNMYYCYFSSLGDPFQPHRGSYLRYWVDWNYMDRTLLIVKAVHLGLNASYTLSRLLNSEVTDELFQSYRSDSTALNALMKVAVSPVAIGLLAYDTFWPLCMLLFSFVAFYLDKYWLYVPCLFDVAFQLTFMNFLYAAVALNGSKIWYTLVLAFLCLYFYSIIAALYFSQQYSLDNHSGCDNVIACFKLHLDYGLYNVPSWDNDGYISPTLPFPFVYGTLVARALGTMYNVSYVILINLVLQSIISGLIIDTFSKLREENEAVLQDISDKCFVCSISRDEFEQAGIPFKKHITEEHNMWHYVWFKIYLESKDPLTYSSSENHSAENLNDTQVRER